MTRPRGVCGVSFQACRSYATLGYCYYGARCRFLHKNAPTPILETAAVSSRFACLCSIHVTFSFVIGVGKYCFVVYQFSSNCPWDMSLASRLKSSRLSYSLSSEFQRSTEFAFLLFSLDGKLICCFDRQVSSVVY